MRGRTPCGPPGTILLGGMAEEFRILPSSTLARASRACPLLEEQSDREAWAACCSRRFLPLARRLAGDNDLAEDILQESWVRVLEHVCEYHGGSPACSWVRAIVHNCALDMACEGRPAGDEPRADLDDPSPDPAARAEQRQLLLLLSEMSAMVAALPAASASPPPTSPPASTAPSGCSEAASTPAFGASEKKSCDRWPSRES